MPTATITFGEVAENGPGMQQLGAKAGTGLTYEELLRARDRFAAAGFPCELICLISAAGVEELGGEAGPEPAYILVVRGGAAAFAPPAALAAEQCRLVPDTKAIFRGVVKNKLARHNLTFGDEAQEPDYAAGRGTIVPFAAVPALAAVRARLPAFFGPKAADLLAEGNYYINPGCGIGWHGDAERRIVIALRFGDSMPLHFQWFLRSRPVGLRVALTLDGGDLYAMSHKAVGTDWRSSSFPTLRHAAGARKYLTIAPKA
jgi:alkylated DNA repair dioxygenase AlkB